MDPQPEQHEQRQPDVQEHQQGEQAVVDAARREEVPGQRLCKQLQRVEPFHRSDGGELREPVPHDPEPDHTRRQREPQQRNAGHPGKPAEALKTAVQQLAQQV